jgi:hypothetical protein
MDNNAPPLDQEINPISVIKYQPEEKSYVLEPNKYDIGKYLTLLKITPYQNINITLKEGNYTWDEKYSMPDNTIITMTGARYNNNGNDNIVTIIISKKYTKIYENKEYSLNNRLKINHNCSFYMVGIDIIEKINDSRPRYDSSDEIGIFNLKGSYIGSSEFSLTFGRFEISSSPFINVAGNCVRGRINLYKSHFKKNSFANESEIFVIDTNCGCNGRGSLAEVFKSITDVQGCKLTTNNNNIIIYEDNKWH